MSTLSRRSRLLIDAAVAVLVGAFAWFAAQVSRWSEQFGPDVFERRRFGERFGQGWPDLPYGSYEVWWTPLPFVVLIVAGLALRRFRPRTGFVAVVLAATGYLAVGGPYGPVLLAPMLATFGLATSGPPRTWAPWLALLIPMLTAHFWTSPDFGLLDPQLYAAFVVGAAAILLPTMFGLLRRNRIQSDRSAQQTERDRIAYEERLRVAREVHDVVGHSLSVISMQAGVALHVLDRRPEQAGEALTAIRDTSRDALAELRSTLQVFRDPDAPLAPPPGLNRLPGLVAALRTAGREVIVDDRRHGADLPAAVDLAALRIVQESLTNVVRHTDAATVTVELSDDDRTLTIAVTDDGPVVGELVEGNGIAGLRERARSLGGTVVVARRPQGGVQVLARLPMEAA